jgi:CubicO group peptidase (beta-lactamase class C family)
MIDFNAANRTYSTRPPASPVTVRHLATHTSGLGYPFSNATLAALAAGGNQPPPDYPLLHDPGTRWTYGESTRALGRIIEVISGKPLDVFLEERLFAPLGMHDTSFTTTADRAGRVATIHRRLDGRLVESPNTPNANGAIASPVQGDGGLSSSRCC